MSTFEKLMVINNMPIDALGAVDVTKSMKATMQFQMGTNL